MKIERLKEIETTDIQIGDRIHVSHYTATCQSIGKKGALFCFDQYLDRAMAMNEKNTNRGGYKKSDLRKALQSDEVLSIFADIRDHLVPFETGDLIRIPFAGEFFGDDIPDWCEPDGHKQWPLMRDSHNRAASRHGGPEIGWLQNKGRGPATLFFVVEDTGLVRYWGASSDIGVRPVFMIKEEER